MKPRPVRLNSERIFPWDSASKQLLCHTTAGQLSGPEALWEIRAARATAARDSVTTRSASIPEDLAKLRALTERDGKVDKADRPSIGHVRWLVQS